MLTEIYIEALMVDDELADQVWEAWHAGEIDDQAAFIAWRLIVSAQIRAKLLLNRNQIRVFSPIFDPK